MTLTCRELTDFLIDYLEGDLPGGQRSEFERHMDACPPCRVYLDQYRQTVRMGKAAFRDPGAPVSEECPPELIEAVMAARSKR